MEHYADCGCVGISNAEDDGWELQDQDGVLYGIRQDQSNLALHLFIDIDVSPFD
jgi:hypothetical protein